MVTAVAITKSIAAVMTTANDEVQDLVNSRWFEPLPEPPLPAPPFPRILECNDPPILTPPSSPPSSLSLATDGSSMDRLMNYQTCLLHVVDLRHLLLANTKRRQDQ